MGLGEPVDVANESADVDPGPVETETYCDLSGPCYNRSRYIILPNSIFILNTLTYLRLSMPRPLHRCRYLEISAGYRITFQCKFGECTAIFKSSGMFNRHYKTHLPASQRHMRDCTFEGCDRVGREGFSRKDNLIQHLRRVHHQDIPKTWRRKVDRTTASSN